MQGGHAGEAVSHRGLSRSHPGAGTVLGAALVLAAALGAGLPAGAAAQEPSPCREELRAALGDGATAPDSSRLARLRALAERCPDDHRVAVGEAEALSRGGREAEAARRFLAARGRWPEEPEVALGYARHLVRWRRFAMVEAAVAAVPRPGPFAAEAAWLEVAALAGQLRFASAAEAARRAAALGGPRADSAAAARLERLHQAQAVAEARPLDFAVQLSFGRELGDFGLYEEAYRRLHRARAADTTSAEPDYRIAELLQREGRLEPAANTLVRALGTDPAHRAARRALAEVLVRLERWREAIPHLERCVAENPADAISAYNLACLLARAGRPEDSLRALRQAVDAGYDRWDAMAADPDLAPLRGQAGYEELMRRRPAAR